MKNKIIAFDFDGVIFDSTEAKTKAFEILYKDHVHGDKLQEIISFHKDNFGISRYTKFKFIEETLLQKSYSEEREFELDNNFSKILENLLIEQKIFPYTNQLLEYLKKEMFNLIIVSGAPHNEIVEILSREHLNEFFSEIYDGTSTKLEHFSMIFKKYNITNKDIIFLGDSTTDLDTAKKLNLFFISVNANYSIDSFELYRFKNIKTLYEDRKVFKRILDF